MIESGMPEGNVIHYQARLLSRAFRRKVVGVDSPQGRFAAGAALVTGRTVTGIEANGKHLFVHFDNERTIHVHLGLFGKWTWGTGTAPDVAGQVRLRMMTAASWAELRGPTVCEVLDQAGVAAALARIGPDPIRADADPLRAWRRVSGSGAPVAGLLMDQRTFAGVGNIYRAEVLFRHGIDPYRPGRALARQEFDAIWADLVALMTAGTKRGRIDTVRPEHAPDAMGRPARRDRHGGEVYVYRRAGLPCLVCGTEVARADVQGRNLYWCPTCQTR